MWCILGVVVLHTNTPLGYFLSFFCQEAKILLHFNYIYDRFSIKINVEMGEMQLEDDFKRNGLKPINTIQNHKFFAGMV